MNLTQAEASLLLVMQDVISPLGKPFQNSLASIYIKMSARYLLNIKPLG